MARKDKRGRWHPTNKEIERARAFIDRQATVTKKADRKRPLRKRAKSAALRAARDPFLPWFVGTGGIALLWYLYRRSHAEATP